MSWQLLVIGLLPIIFYVFVEVKYGMKAGIITAISLVFVLGIWIYLRFHEIDKLLIMDGVLLIVLGGISLKLNESKYFRFQPAIVAAVFFLYFGYHQLFAEPFLISHMETMKHMAPELEVMGQNEGYQLALAAMSRDLCLVFFLQMLALIYAIYRLSSVQWLLIRLSIYPAIIVVSLIELVRYQDQLSG